MLDSILLTVLSYVLAILIGVVSTYLYYRFKLSNASSTAKKIIDDATIKAEAIKKETLVDAKTESYELIMQAEKEIKEKKQQSIDFENKLLQREQNIDRRDIILQSKEETYSQRSIQLDKKIEDIEKLEEKLNIEINKILSQLEKISGMSANQARDELFKQVEQSMEHEITAYVKEQEEEAKLKASLLSREIIATAINRFSQEEVIDKTVSVVSLPSEEMKGRIIGREGRNIRTIEKLTGVDLIIDDTPETITISSFDPVRREIAKKSLEVLVRDGRIQPGRIEEVVNKSKDEVEEIMLQAGEDAVFQLGLSKVDKKIISLIGRLKFRTSYGQNALQHSIEVAHLCGIMAAELGLNQKLARRSGLLHDIGKAIDYEVEGSHIEIGAKIARKYGEDEVVINSIESHHGDIESKSIIAILVAAADTLSAARPGSRSESLENYIQRLEKLEAVANEFSCVEKAYVMQAGREIRVIVKPEELDDLGCHKLARDIKMKIESELVYPGTIKVTVVREIRANEIAK